MKPESGKFICPFCKERRLSVYTNWLSKYKFNEKNQNERHWIFYFKTISYKKTFGCIWNSCILENFRECGFMLIISILLLLFYLPILIWVDLIIYICSKNKYTYTYLSKINDKKKIDETLIDVNEYNIWSKFMGIPEGLIIKNGNNLFRCINCNWNPNTFKDFIPELTTIKNPESYINNNNIIDKGTDEDNNYTKFESKEGDLSVIFSSTKFQYSVVCNSNDKFEYIENRFYNEYPEYKKKKCFYMVKGSVITDKTKTLDELNIGNSDTIVIREENNEENY